jgi:hypothetical protein
MYAKAAVWATSATSLPMWGVEGSGMIPLPNMVADFRDRLSGTAPLQLPQLATIDASSGIYVIPKRYGS